MNRRYSRKKDGLARKRFSVLLFLAICFLGGTILGCIFTSYSTVSSNSGLLEYMEHYLLLVQEEYVERPSFFSLFWEVSRWPLIAGVLGLTLLGPIAIPSLFVARGFLLTYAVSIFVSLWGTEGLVLAAAIFGISALFSITALFFIGTDAFTCSQSLNKAGGRAEESDRMARQKDLLFQLVITLCWIGAGTMIQFWLSPIFLKASTALFV